METNSNMKRIFAAIKIKPTDNFIDVFDHFNFTLRNEKIKWVNIENIHITLKFFGETPESKITEISNIFHEIAENHDKFILNIKKAGVFGSNYDPKVIWFGIDDSLKLRTIVSNITENLKTINYLPDRQNFVPHLTIGRIKFLMDKNKLIKLVAEHKDVFIQECPVNEFVLYESVLKSEGPVYGVLDKYVF